MFFGIRVALCVGLEFIIFFKGKTPFSILTNLYHIYLSFQQGVVVEIVRILPDSPPPTLSNIFCNSTEANPSDMVR